MKLSWFASPLPLRPIKQWNKNAYHTEKSSCLILRGKNPLWWCYLYVEKWYLSIVRTPCTDINCFNTWAIILASSSQMIRMGLENLIFRVQSQGHGCFEPHDLIRKSLLPWIYLLRSILSKCGPTSINIMYIFGFFFFLRFRVTFSKI